MQAKYYIEQAARELANAQSVPVEKAKANALLAIALLLQDISEKVGNLRWR